MSALILGTLLGLVCLRSWVCAFYPHAHFDSDQAVFGLMSKDLIHGRSFPMYMYGQRYLLCVSVWFAAPFLALFGTTVAALKLPLLAMNLAVVWMSWVSLRREGFSPSAAALCILPFAACGAVVASRLVEHQGGTIEPFFFLALAYLLRDRPILLGLEMGVAFQNREFSLIGFFALLLMDVAQGAVRSRWKQRALSAGLIAATTLAIRFIAAKFSTDYHGGTAAMGSPRLENLFGFFKQQLPSLVGAERTLRDFNITSNLTAGHDWLYVAFGVLALLACIGARKLQRKDLGGYPTYCLLIGAGQAAAFILLSPSGFDAMLVRYILLVLLIAVGFVGWAWQDPKLRPAVAAIVLAMSLSNVIDHARLVAEYARERPRHENELLADALVERGVKYATAGYWLAFDVSYLTDERVIACPPVNDGQRSSRYVRIIERQRDVPRIQDADCAGAERIVRWNLCR